MIKALHHGLLITSWKVYGSSPLEWETEFFFHFPIALKWLMQFSSNIPQGFASLTRCLPQLPKLSRQTQRKRWHGRTKWEPFLKSNCFIPASKDDVLRYLPHSFRYNKSETFGSHEIDHFSFINILAKLFEPCSFFWRSPVIIQTTSPENKWEPHLSRPGVSNEYTVSLGWIV